MIQGEWIETTTSKSEKVSSLNLSLMIQGEWIETLILAANESIDSEISL